MNPTEINKRIAEACGWKYHPKKSSHRWESPNETFFPSPKSYYGDLNAIHEAVMSLDDALRNHIFRRALAKSVGVYEISDWELSLICLDKLTNATAPQRCEAFLRTLGLLEESK